LSLVIRAGIEGARYRRMHPQPRADQHNINLNTNSGHGHGLADLLEEAVELGESGSASLDEAVRRFGCGIETEETIPLVFYLLGWCSHRENMHENRNEEMSREETSRYALFKNAILMAVNMGGDTDTVAGIVGAILGGWAGIDNIPREWLDAIDAEGFIQRFGIAAILHVHNLEYTQK
ncbi:MAG: ADP-ribosylglycohydrolase family protein, partial [Methanosarcinales archaeon]|nr:ADP-ribosylglycohydrolase family protein [Methanosarcinales archaeon]